jgi:hypothetical protein
LLDLKADLENGDTSIAEILIPVKDERRHRIYISGWLREKVHGRYSVPPEEELADRKKPDMRIHGFGFDGPVPIELKVADNWLGTVLVERLHNQLCGQYLRDVRSNCGIYLLVYRGQGRKTWQIPGSRKRIDFTGLIRLLKDEAQKIIMKDTKIESIKIIGVDLTKRIKKTKA